MQIGNTFDEVGPQTALPKVDFSEPDFEKFGTLYKHCKKVHLPRFESSIRVGTLSEYRKNENVAVRDGDEGMFKILLNFAKPTQVEIERLLQITLGTSPTASGINTNNIRVKSFSGTLTNGCVFSTDEVLIDWRSATHLQMSGQVTIHAEGADAYVFCLSQNTNSDSVILDPEYDSVWSIRPGKVLEFVDRMTGFLADEIRNGNGFTKQFVGPFLGSPGFSQPPRDESLRFGICAEIRKVIYQYKVIEIRENISHKNIHDVWRSIDMSAFIKDEWFCTEEEVRVIFRPVVTDSRNGARYLFPNLLNPAFIPFADFMDLVE